MHVEKRWALTYGEGGVFLGRYCWPDATKDEYAIRTFRTRAQARFARKQMTSYRLSARIARVTVVTEIEE